MMTNIAGLPQELLEKITSYLTIQDDLLNLMKSNKTLYQKASPSLFGELYVLPAPISERVGLNVTHVAPCSCDVPPLGSVVNVYKPHVLRQTLNQHPELKTYIRVLHIDVPQHAASSVVPGDPGDSCLLDEIDTLVGNVLARGGRLPSLNVATDSSGWVYRGHANVWHLRASGNKPLVLSLDQVYEVMSLPKIDRLILAESRIQDAEHTDESRYGTCSIKHVIFNVRLEWRDMEYLAIALRWPKALESFTCLGAKDLWNPSGREGTLARLVDLLQPQCKTLKSICFLPGNQAQVRRHLASRELAAGLENFDVLESLHIPLEYLQYFSSDQDEGSFPNDEPCKLPPDLKHLRLQVNLRLEPSSPDADDMPEKALVLLWIAGHCPTLKSVTLDMIYTGLIHKAWGPQLLRRRADELMSSRSAFEENGTILEGNVVLKELGWKHPYLTTTSGWRELCDWLRSSRHDCNRALW